MNRVRWGVLGVSELVGRLAVCPALRRSPTAEFAAIASRNLARARAEATRFGVTRAYGNYQALLDDPQIEAVYIPLPNSMHLEWTLKAAAAGKHVLCEKPLACNAMEAEEMAAACRRAGVLLMEAYMTPFHPRDAAALDLARSGALGELRFAHAAFTGELTGPDNYRWRPEMGGGCLLDVGIYCLAPILSAIGREPLAMHGHGAWTAGGVDASFGGWLDFGGGVSASFNTSFEAPEQQRLEFTGTDGVLTVDRAYTPTAIDTELRVWRRDGSLEVVTAAANDPYYAMVEHFAAAIRGEASLQRPPEESVRLLRLLDRLRASATPAGKALR